MTFDSDPNYGSLTAGEIVNEYADTPSEIRVLSPGLNLEYTGDNTRLREEMPGLSFTPLRDAVRTLMTYYRPHP